MDTVTKSNMAARAGLVEYRVMFASLGAVCSVLVDLLAVTANWIEDPCKRNHLRLLQG